MWAVRRVAVVLVVVAGLLWQGAAGVEERQGEERDPVGCGPALTFLMERGVAEEDHLARLPSGDGGNVEGSDVCGGGACCLPSMTEALKVAGRRSLSQVVSDTADNLLGGLRAQRHAFHSAVESALASSELRAMRVLETRYARVAAAAQPVLQKLYAGLRAGLTQADERPLKRSLAAFWDDLFPPVYHSVLHTLPLPFTERYSQCLREARHIVRPWGPIPILVGEPLLRGMHSARLMLHSLDVGVHVLQAAQNLHIGPQCSEAAARMELCGACHGSLLSPCPGLCRNVARGCLAPLAEVDGAWADLSGAVTRVQESLQVVRLAHLLHQLPDKVSEAIMVAMEHGPRLLKKIRKNCSSPMYVEETGEEALNTHHRAPEAEQTEAEETEENLEEELKKEERASRRVLESVGGAVGAVEAARHWWTGLPETHCRSIASNNNGSCWNGVRVGPYTKSTAGVGISVQKYNPEVRVDRPDTSVYSLADKLRGVRRLVMTTLTWLPKSVSRRSHNYAQQMEGSGSGVDVTGMEMAVESSYNRGRRPSDDDEENDYYGDYYGEESSGDGGYYGSGDHYPEEPLAEKGIPALKTETASGQHHTGPSSLVTMVVVAVAGIVMQRHGG